MKLGRIVLGLAALAALAVGVWSFRGRRGPTDDPRVTRHAGPLEVTSLRAVPEFAVAGATVRLEAAIRRPRSSKGELSITWGASVGHVAGGLTATATWLAPAIPGRHKVGILVELDGARAARYAPVTVRLPPSGRGYPEVRASLTALAPNEGEQKKAAEHARRIKELRDQLLRGDYGTRGEKVTLLSELGRLLAEGGDHAGALEAFYLCVQGHALDDAKGNHCRQRYGMAALRLGRHEEALQALLDADQQNTVASRTVLGNLLESEGRLDEALTQYESVAKQDIHGSTDAGFRAAMIYVARGDEGAAVELLVAESQVFGRGPVEYYLAHHPDAGPLRAALQRSGRAGELSPRPTASRPVLPKSTYVHGQDPTVIVDSDLGGGHEP